MNDRIVRIGLVVMAISYVSVGAWAQFAPRSFYNSFPGGGRHWISPDGAFNEHLIRDVGGLNLALAVLSVVAAVVLTRPLVLSVCVASLVYYVPHLIYHASHLDPLPTADAVAEVVSLGLAVLVPIAVLVVANSRSRAVKMVPTQ